MADTTIRVESELPLQRVTFPPRIDHSWAFTTSAVHARPFRLQPDDSAAPEAVTLEQLDETSFRVVPGDRVLWTDGKAITADEVERCLTRGGRILRKDLWIGQERDGTSMIIRSDAGERTLAQALSSAVFALTPDIRDETARATSGAYRISGIADGGHHVSLRARTGSRELQLMATSAPAQGRTMFGAGQLDLTRVVGGRRGKGWPGSDRSLMLTMGLRSKQPELARMIAAAIDFKGVAAATGGTYSPADRTAASESSPLPAGALTISYADFFPNREAAASIAQQLPSLTTPQLTAVPYDRYLAADLSSQEARLEIVEPLTPDRLASDFVPLLRANTTCDAGPRIVPGSAAINARGEVLWDSIEMSEQ